MNLHRIDDDVAKFADSIETAPDGVVFVVGRRDDKGTTKGGKRRKADWHIQGIFTKKKMAINACIDETYFVGPLPLNVALPHKTIAWIGLTWPLKK